MGEVIDRWRLNQGWNPLDNDSQQLAIQSWCDILDAAKVPHTAYNELFKRAVRNRAKSIANGHNVPNFGVELLLSCWVGEYGLASEMERERIHERRYLADANASTCEKCLGTGMERVYEDGEFKGVRAGCRH